jgi:hypothetical protein
VLEIKEARQVIMHRFGLKKEDFSNCVHQFKSHINKKFKRDRYPVMLQVFENLVTWNKGRPKNI